MTKEAPKFYTRTKRDEMTFGILPDFVPTDIVPDLKGSAKLYTANEVHGIMMDMDPGFVGMPRATIDRTEAVRQLILYTLAGKLVDGIPHFAVYQRAAGAEAKLKDGFSVGFGGHVEVTDLIGHYEAGDTQGTMSQIPEVPSSFFSTLTSGVRELSEEVMFYTPDVKPRDMTTEEQLGILSMAFGLTAGIELHGVEEFTDELKRDAMLHSDTYVLRRSEVNPMEGKIYILIGGVSLSAIFKELTGQDPIHEVPPADINSNVVPCGFISDRDIDNAGWIGNTHLGVIAVVRVDDVMDFKLIEDKYTAIGWKTKEELEELLPRCEPWTQYLIPLLDGITDVLISECRTEAPAEEQ